MLKFLSFWIALLGLGFSWVSNGGAAPTAPVFEQYEGVLRHPSLKRDQPAKLDFVTSLDENNQPQIIGILTVIFGDFSSHEYTSYHFENVVYDATGNRLIFNQPDQPVTLVTQTFTPDEIRAELHSVWSVETAELIVKRPGKMPPQLPLIEPVWGEYRGQCHLKTETLQINTYRYTEDTTKVGNPFASYTIRGEIGWTAPNGDPKHLGCGAPNEPPCSQALIESGAYNFYTGDLNLLTRMGQKHCDTKSDGLQCGSCFYRRISPETQGNRQLTRVTSTPAFPSPAVSYPPPKDQGPELKSGDYVGYLHHEFLDEYQAAGLSIMVYPEPGKTGSLHLTGLGRLAFGDIHGPEFIPYRFEDRVYSTLSPGVLIFKNRAADIDVILQVTFRSETAMRGVWFSRLFGRVGTFELRRDGTMPTLPPKAVVMGSVSGQYESSFYDLEIQIRQGKTPLNSDNPFFPNVFSGDVIPKQIGGKDEISGGSFDFYTGRIEIDFDSGRYFSGERVAGGERLYLNHSFFKFYSRMLPHTNSPFRRVPVGFED